MIQGLGMDIVDIARLERAAARRGPRLLARLFTPEELAYCDRQHRPFQSYAARFAAKEAFLKALGQAAREGITWQDMSVVREGSGPPRLTLRARALEATRARSIQHVHLSLSHTRDYAVGVVVLERGS